ncbi:hypothetical protein [Emticicia fluvialis]|nr:hypothetical protein [Emticicia fluvialis]
MAKQIFLNLPVRNLQDYGWMYHHAFADLDGHEWEVFWMDPNGYPSNH